MSFVHGYLFLIRAQMTEITRQIQSHDAFKLVNRVRLGQTGGLSLMLSLDLYLPDRGLGSAEV